MMRYILVLILSFHALLPVFSQEEDSLFYHGVIALSEERYEDAVSIFTSVIDQEPSFSGFLNLSIAHGKTNDWANALWAAEAALKYNPTSKDAVQNAEYAMRQIDKKRTWVHPYGTITKLISSMEVQTWYIFTWLFSLLTAGLLIVLFHPTSRWKKSKVLFMGCFASFLIFLISYAAGARLERHFSTVDYVMPIHNEVQTFARMDGIKLNETLKIGDRYTFIQEQDDWVQLYFSDQKPVWVSAKALKSY